MRRWIGEQANSLGVLTESMILSDKPNFGTWTLEVNAFVSKIIVTSLYNPQVCTLITV